MTERNVDLVVDRLLGDRECYLNEGVAYEITCRLVSPAPPRAVVVHLDGVRTKAWGVCREFATLGPVEVYV